MTLGRPSQRSLTGPGTAPIGFALAALVLSTALLWSAGGLASLVTGHGWPDTSVRQAPAIAGRVLTNGFDVAAAWPLPDRHQLGPVPLIWLVFVAELVMIGLVATRVVLWWLRRRTVPAPAGARAIVSPTVLPDLDLTDRPDELAARRAPSPTPGNRAPIDVEEARRAGRRLTDGGGD